MSNINADSVWCGTMDKNRQPIANKENLFCDVAGSVFTNVRYGSAKHKQLNGTIVKTYTRGQTVEAKIFVSLFYFN
jgi:hypothetical protein